MTIHLRRRDLRCRQSPETLGVDNHCLFHAATKAWRDAKRFICPAEREAIRVVRRVK